MTSIDFVIQTDIEAAVWAALDEGAGPGDVHEIVSQAIDAWMSGQEDTPSVDDPTQQAIPEQQEEP